MSLNKAQKQEQIELGLEKVKASENLVFVDFNKVSVENIKKLRRELKSMGSDFKVIKKRLLKIAFQKAGLDFDPLQFKAQLGTIFLPKDLSSFAATIYKFAKGLEKSKKGEFKILGSLDVLGKKFIDVNEFNIIAKLPSREVLLAQVVMMLTMPIKQVMMVLQKRSNAITPESKI